MRETVLHVRNLEKQIGARKIVADVYFDVVEGEVFGFLGPNGAGKTTTIRMLVGLIAPTAGYIEIAGIPLRQRFTEAMRHIGCIVENPELYKFLTGRENLEQFSRMLGDVSPERIDEVVRLVRLEARIDDLVKTYSLGMRQRLGIAQALLGRPRLLILDEPTNGLDPAGIRELREFVRQLADEENIAVFVSSHILSEIEMMCDRVAIISHGKVLRVGTVAELLAAEERSLLLEVDNLERAKMLISDFVGDSRVTEEQHLLKVDIEVEAAAHLNELLVKNGILVYQMRRQLPTLEDLFMEVTGGQSIE